MNLNNDKEIASFLKRRTFLGGCAGLTGTSLMSSVLQLQVTNSAVAAIPNFRKPNQYKALVCVFLYGGNDSFNMLAPLGREYDSYRRIRGELAIPEAELEANSIDGPGSRRFGLHPSMPEVRNLYRNGDLSFIANVGTLVRPVEDATEFQALGVRNRPRGLFAHNNQQESWQTSLADRASRSGWMGRIADMITDEVNNNENISMNIAMEDPNILQTGFNVTPYVAGRSGAITLRSFRTNYENTTDRMLDSRYRSVIQRQYRDSRLGAISSAASYNDAIRGVNVGSGGPSFTGRLGEQLELVARNIQARGEFDSTRQTFFVFQNGYDTHNSINAVQPGLLAELSQNLAAFQNEMDRLGVSDQVTTYTASDFGRTLTPNGRGSDHAWGGNSIVMGGAVRGGRIFGNYPRDLENPSLSGRDLDVGRGRILPTTSVDELHAELARWYGVPNDASLENILPNVRRFYGAGVNAPMPIGFLRT